MLVRDVIFFFCKRLLKLLSLVSCLNGSVNAFHVFGARYRQEGKPSILNKNVKKNARCICNFRILPSKARFTQDIPPSPQKSNVEVWAEHFCCLLNNIDQGGVGGGVTMVPNT